MVAMSKVPDVRGIVQQPFQALNGQAVQGRVPVKLDQSKLVDAFDCQLVFLYPGSSRSLDPLGSLLHVVVDVLDQEGTRARGWGHNLTTGQKHEWAGLRQN